MRHRFLLPLGALCAMQLVAISTARADDPTPGGVSYEDASVDDGCTAGEETGELEHGTALGLASVALALVLRARRAGSSAPRLAHA